MYFLLFLHDSLTLYNFSKLKVLHKHIYFSCRLCQFLMYVFIWNNSLGISVQKQTRLLYFGLYPANLSNYNTSTILQCNSTTFNIDSDIQSSYVVYFCFYVIISPEKNKKKCFVLSHICTFATFISPAKSFIGIFNHGMHII